MYAEPATELPAGLKVFVNPSASFLHGNSLTEALHPENYLNGGTAKI
jgi:hypothetical protein